MRVLQTARVLLLIVATLAGSVLGALAQGTPAVPAPAACADGAATPVASAYPMTVTDDAGRSVTVAAEPQRIVTIAPSNTEIAFALGLGDRVVAVDPVSDYPPEATAKPRIGGYIDPNPEELVAAKPDLVLVTAAAEGPLLDKLDSLGLTTVVVEPTNLDGVLASIDLVGAIAGVPEAAHALTCEMAGRIAAVAAAVAGEPQPRVFLEYSPDLYTAGPGSFGDDLIRHAGGTNIAADATTAWPQLSTEAVVAADPEVVLLGDGDAGTTPEQVAARPGWSGVAAVRDGRVVLLNADLVARPGPRIVDGLEAMARAIHPDKFPPAASTPVAAGEPATSPGATPPAA